MEKETRRITIDQVAEALAKGILKYLGEAAGE